MSKTELRTSLKRIFTGYRRLDGKMERDLRTLGISVKRHRNHIILEVEGKDGCVRRTPISVSGSDKRSGLNTVSDIMRMIYC